MARARKRRGQLLEYWSIRGNRPENGRGPAERVLALPLDVTDQAAAERAVRQAIGHFGRLDVVVNNAGYANIAPVEEVSMADFRAQVEAVFFGTVHVTKAVLPHFRERGAGHFIQVTSNGGRSTAPGVGAYQSAKYAVEGFSGVLNDEVAGLGIKVALAEPGAMRTDWAGASMEIHPFDEAYRPTVGAIADRLRTTNGHEPIDPAKVARGLLDVAAMDDPPLHLILGGSAAERNKKKMRELVEEDARWEPTARSVDFD